MPGGFMLKRKSLFPISSAFCALILVCTLFVLISAFSRPSQEQHKPRINDKGKLPLAVYTAPEPTDPTQRAIRKARNSRYDKRNYKPFDQLPLNRKETGSMGGDYFSVTPVLPASESDAIIIGEVVNAKGYVSNDKTGAYSEFNVRVIEVLKTDNNLSADLIVVEREGATVQLPDGRTIRYVIGDLGVPRIGGEYVFFLRYYADGQIYNILDLYELYDERAIRLDTRALYLKYSETEESKFLNELRADIAKRERRR
jgi:hypothetical protein